MQPEYKTATVLWAGSAESGKIVLDNLSLYLASTYVYQLGLFLKETPLVSTLVTMLLWPEIGVEKSRLEWKHQYPQVQQYFRLPILVGDQIFFFAELGNDSCQFCNILEGNNTFGMTRGEFRIEGAVGGGESCYGGAVIGSVSCKISDGIDSLLMVRKVQGTLLDVVGGLESGTGGGKLGLAPLIVGRSEIVFEGGPGFESRVKALPKFAIFDK